MTGTWAALVSEPSCNPSYTHISDTWTPEACLSQFEVHSLKRSEPRNENPHHLEGLIKASTRSLNLNDKAGLMGSHSPALSLAEVTQLLEPWGPFLVSMKVPFTTTWTPFSSPKSPFRGTRCARNLIKYVSHGQCGTAVPNKVTCLGASGQSPLFLLSWVRLAGSTRDTFPKCSALPTSESASSWKPVCGKGFLSFRTQAGRG